MIDQPLLGGPPCKTYEKDCQNNWRVGFRVIFARLGLLLSHN